MRQFQAGRRGLFLAACAIGKLAAYEGFSRVWPHLGALFVALLRDRHRALDLDQLPVAIRPDRLLVAQRGQAHAGGVEATVHGQHLAVHIAGRGAAQKARDRGDLVG